MTDRPCLVVASIPTPIGPFALLTIMAAFSLAGCDAPSVVRAPVSGAVFVGATPLKAGNIRFVPLPPTAGPMATAVVVDGRYELSAENGPVPGAHRVEVVATDHLGFDPGDEAAAAAALKANAGRLPSSPVPAGYGARSPLTADIPPEGRDDLNFLLTRGGPTAGR